MGSALPTEDEISQVIDFTGLNPTDDHDMVKLALTNNERNVENVISQYFDNPENFRRGYGKLWDETMFGADRDGSANNTGISFHIESPSQNDVIQGVTPPPDGQGIGGPSRPPSRSNNRSPLGRMLDWTADDATGTIPPRFQRTSLTEAAAATGGPNSQAEEDEDMKRALRASAQEAGIDVAEQESGVVDASTSVSHFGPANRNDYDPGNWAMVPTQASQTQLNNAPAPALRKRAPDTPAFLVKGLTTDASHRLGGLVTILHQIPLARNVLLESGSPAATYGHNSEWWKGQEILPPHVLAKLQTGELQWGAQEEDKPNFEEEIHRLLAFLDQTERGYGTVSVLVNVLPWPDIGPEKRFYEMLMDRNAEVAKPLSQTAAVVQVLGDDQGDDKIDFGLLELEIPREHYESIKTLYEAIDHVLWSDTSASGMIDQESRMAMFKGLGEVLVLKIGAEGPAQEIEIPVELYPERWMSTRKDEARRIQRGLCDIQEALQQANESGRRLNEYRDNINHQVFDKRELIRQTNERWGLYADFLEDTGRYRGMKDSGFDTDKYPTYRAAPLGMDDEEQETLGKVNNVLDWAAKAQEELKGKTAILESQLDEIKAKKRFLGKLLTDPNKPGRPTPMSCKKYMLRGVATGQDVVYVCQRAEADLIELGDKPRELDQWWRLAYKPNDELPVNAEKVEIERVLRDMWLETRTPLLVYATEEAVNTPRAALSGPLERFVRADNKAFRQELNRESNEAAELKRTGPEDPMSPSKRQRSNSPDSMDSNRASLGSVGDNGFNDPFVDEGFSEETEMVEVSGKIDDVARSVDVESTMGGMDEPNWITASGKNTSATLTPSTLAADEIDPSDLRTGQRGDESRTMTPGPSEDARSPEMQERARPPAFVTLSRSSTEPKANDSMDMEISDQRD